MKKYLMILCCAMLLLFATGCGKKNQVVCSKTATEDGKTITISVTLDFDGDDKVTNASLTYDFGDKEVAETYCNLLKESKSDASKDAITCSGTKITVKNVDDFEEDETEDSEKMVGQVKESVIKAATDDGFTCK